MTAALEFLTDFYLFSAHFLWIKTKDARITHLILKDYQREVIEIILSEMAKGRPVKIIILKARQMGISTIIAAFFFWLVTTKFNRKLVLIADIASRTDEVFDIYRRFLDNYPKELRPMIEKNNEREIVYQNPNKEERAERPGLQSEIKAETAQDENAGRSGTTYYAHKTEKAYFPYPGAIDIGLGGSMTTANDSLEVEESTANGIAGVGGHYFNRWTNAVAGLNDYIPIFIAWYKASEYEAPLFEGFELTEDESKHDDEIAAYSEYWRNLDFETRCRKLLWRRIKINSYAGDPKLLYEPEVVFDQEYPWCPDVAFIASGNPVYDVKKLRNQINYLTVNKPYEFKIESIVKDTFLENYLKGLKVYELPENGKRYVIAADVSEGIGQDASHIKILDDEANEVACFHGMVDPDILGQIMVALGHLYNNALLNPEVNNMGHTTISTIKRLGYTNIYQREIRDKYTDLPRKVLGWKTTVATKDAMINLLRTYHRDGHAYIREVETLREMTTMTRDESGYTELNGKDRVAALCIALETLKQLPQKTSGAFQKPAEPDIFSLPPEQRRKVYEKKNKGSYYD